MRPIDADALWNRIKGHLCDGIAEGEALEAIDEAPTVSGVCGWVSVKDRLPTYAEVKDDRVLVLTESGDIFSIGFDECIEDESIFGMWRQNFDPVTLGATDSDWIPCDGVTHWMPVPERPEEEDDDD